jgi:SAM-dependent methyltransferase
MEFDDSSYYRAYDRNYRVAYGEGLAYLGQGAPGEKRLRRLEKLLWKTGLRARGTRLLDVGCGDGTNGLFLARLGYRYTGIDVSEAAVERARRRAAEAGLALDFRVADVLDMTEFQAGEFPLVLDSFCLHMLVLDTHRAAYFANVKRVMHGDGFLVLLANRDETAYEGPVESFAEFCRLSGTDPSGIAFEKCVEGRWVEVAGKKVYLLGRAKSLRGYREELTRAGSKVEHQSTWGPRRARVRDVAFVLKRQ